MSVMAAKKRETSRLSRQDEAELIARVLDGDGEAFAILIDAFSDRLYALAVGILRNGSAAEDVVQESLIKAYKNLAKFRGESSIYTWLYRITVNTAHNYIRTSKRHNGVNMDDIGPILEAAGPNPLQKAAGSELATAISEAVETLPERQKEVFLLHFYQQLTHREISETLGITEGAVKANYFHAIQKMRNYLKIYMD